MGRPRTHGPQTEAELLAAAGTLLAAEGVGALTIRRLADEVGTTTRAVYSRFGDKAGLLRALFRQAAETMADYHEAVPVQADPVAEVVDLALAYRSGALAVANLYERVYLGAGAPGLAPGSDDLAVAYRSLDRVVETLERCARGGLLGDRDPAVVVRQLWALVHGLASLELRGALGDAAGAPRLWHDAVLAAMAGYAATEAEA